MRIWEWAKEKLSGSLQIEEDEEKAALAKKSCRNFFSKQYSRASQDRINRITFIPLFALKPPLCKGRFFYVQARKKIFLPYGSAYKIKSIFAKLIGRTGGIDF